VNFAAVLVQWAVFRTFDDSLTAGNRVKILLGKVVG